MKRVLFIISVLTFFLLPRPAYAFSGTFEVTGGYIGQAYGAHVIGGSFSQDASIQCDLGQSRFYDASTNTPVGTSWDSCQFSTPGITVGVYSRDLPDGQYYIVLADFAGNNWVSQPFSIVDDQIIASPPNTAPYVNSLSGGTVTRGGIYSENGSFADSDSASWSATVDYGDGSGVIPLALSGMNFTLNHQYNVVGTYTVVVTIQDNQGSIGTVTTTVTVNNPPPVTTTFNSSADTYIRSGQSNQNEGAGLFMRIQSSGDNRALIRFNQSALQSTIGSGTVLSAKLRLTITDNGNNWGKTGRTVDAHRLIVNWVEGNGTENSRGMGLGATWNCAIDSIIQNQAKNCSGTTEWEMEQPNNPAVHPWIQTPSATQTIINNQAGIVEYDVTADVVSFMNGTNNYGWIIKKTNEGQNGQVSFGTKESSSVPQLVVTYQP